jgi:hypothetical protein
VTPEAFILTANLPGVSKDEVSVEIHNNTLILRGERTHEAGMWCWSIRRQSSFIAHHVTVARLRTAMGQRPGHRRPKPSAHHPYAGPTTCLRCDDVFESWDRRQNRLCLRCREAINAEPSEEPRHPFRPPTPRRRTSDDV